MGQPLIRCALLAVGSLVLAACGSNPPEKDPLYEGSPTAQVSAQEISQWNQAYAWGDHADAGYLKAESDPLFSAAPAAHIAEGDIANWSAAYAWGDHADAGYLKAEIDPVYSGSPAASITGDDLTHWDTAYGWGNHATAGYLKTETDPKVGPLSTGAVPRWTGSQLQNGAMTDTGSQVGIGTSAPNAVLDVSAPSVDAVVDQAQTQVSLGALASVLSQTFTAGATGYLSAIDVYYVGYDSTFTVSIRSGSTTLATGRCTAPTAYSWVTCRLPTPVSVTSGNVYLISITAAFRVELACASGDVYAGGTSNIAGGNDLAFRTYVGPLQVVPAFEVGANAVSIQTIMHLTPRATAPSTAEPGDVYYDGAQKKLCYYNGTTWTCL